MKRSFKHNHAKIILIAVAFGIVFLTSCKTLVFKNIFGDATKVDNSHDFEGFWMSSDGFVIAIKVSPDSNSLIIGSMDWNKESQKFETENLTAKISTVGDNYFFNWGKENSYDIKQFEVRTSINGDAELLTWAPNIDVFEQLINEKQIPGRLVRTKNQDGVMETDSVIVSNLSSEMIAKVMENTDLFNYKDVDILRRIGKPFAGE